MKIDIVMELLLVSASASIISTQLIQKVKETINSCKICTQIISIIISLAIGFIYSYTFYTTDIIYSIWVGIFTLIGSDSFYKVFRDKYNLKIKDNT